jgi:hypothetical protein
MQSIYFGATVFFIVVIILWYIQNERSGADGSKGWLAMRAPATKNITDRGSSHRRPDDQQVDERTMARNR